MPALTPITALLTADIAEFRAAMKESSDLTSKFSMAVSDASVRANAAFRSYAAAAKEATAAQAELDKVQKSGTATADEVTAAEDRLAAAQDRLIGSGERAALAQERLMKAQKAQAAAATESTAATAEGGGAMAALTGPVGMAAAAVGYLGYKTISMGGDFQSAMEKLHTQAQVPQSEINSLGDSVLGLAGKLGADPMSLVDALYHVESSFESMPSVLKASGGALGVLETAAKGAIIGGSDLTSTTDALDAAIASGIPGVKDAAQTMAVLNGIVGTGDMKMSDLAKAFSTGMVSQVKLFGGSIQDVGAGLALFGDNIQRAQKAGTLFRMAFQDLALPAVGQRSADAFKEINLKASDLQKTLTNQGLVPALSLLRQKLIDAHIPMKDWSVLITEMFTKKAGTGITEMLGQYDRLLSKYPALSKATKTFDDDWKKTSETWNQQVKRMEDGLKALGIKIGEVLITDIENAVKWVQKVWGEITTWYNKQDILKRAVQICGDILRNDLIKPVQDAFNGISKNLKPAFDDLKKVLDENPKAVHAIELVFGAVLIIITKVYAFIQSSLIKGLIQLVEDGIKLAVGEVELFVKALQKIIDIASNVIGRVRDMAGAISNIGGIGMLQQVAGFLGFADGGPVPGPEGAAMLAIVHGGEYVVSNEMMRTGKIPAQGGGASLGAGVGSRGGGGGGGTPTVENHFYVDGKAIQPAVQRQVLRYNQRNPANGLALSTGR